MQFNNHSSFRGIIFALVISFMALHSSPVEAEDCSEKTGVSKGICELGNVLDDILEDLDRIWSRVKGWTETTANQTWAWTQATYNAIQVEGGRTLGVVADETNGFVGDMKTTFDGVTSNVESTGQDVLDRIRVGIQEVKFHVEYEAEDLAGFIDSSEKGCSWNVCEPFRTELLTFIEQVESVSNTLITFSGSGQEFIGSVDLSLIPPIDYSGLNDLIDRAPGITIYPIYRTFKALDQTGTGDDSILVAITNTLALMEIEVMRLQDAVRAPSLYEWGDAPAYTMSLQSERDVRFKAKLSEDDEADEPAAFCQWMQQKTDRPDGATVRQVFEAVLPYVQGSGLLLKVVGNVGISFTYLFEAHPSVGAGFLAEGDIQLKHNPARTILQFLVTSGDYALDVASFAAGDMQSCDTQIIHHNTQIMHAKQDYIVCILESDRGGARAVDDCEYLKNW